MSDNLSPAQSQALRSLRSILYESGIDQRDDSLLISLLEVESWNVERAARMVQDDNAEERRRSGADDETRTSTREPMEHFEIDDSEVTSLRNLRSGQGSGAPSQRPAGAGLGSRPYGSHPNSSGALTNFLWSALTFPFTLAHSLLLLIARILRLRSLFPGLFGHSGNMLGGRDGRRRFGEATDPKVCAERYIRDLEEETGGTIGGTPRRGNGPQVYEVGGEQSASKGEFENPATPRVKLPPFFSGGYADALKVIKEEIKILVVILTSREHGDVELFRKKTLTDTDLVDALSSSNFVVWGGDVKEREAYQVSTLLEATTYPFVAFIALQPTRSLSSTRSRNSASSGNSTPRPAVLSRLEGSPLTATSASTIVSHITDVLLPRTNPYLERLRNEKRRRERERELKAEQDRAYLEASRRDAERVAKKREEERRLREEELERQRQREEKDALERKRLEWRMWAKAALVPAEPDASEDKVVRLSFRLPNGRNVARFFRATDTLQGVYAFVETASIDPGAALTNPRRPTGYEHEYNFSLVLGYPRRRLGPEGLKGGAQGEEIGSIDGLYPSANLIVEGKVDGMSNDDDESDSDEESEDE
ncbi:hypothetical protein IE53DRAFT_333126 [Violaceomyces palustris]|uniref:Uncharacterized protein n=1 Tax=Violaceomyces palustris TaxID=1673888 RepID=A0ACD0NSK2_9BASI|nr:hypothetical protein IE53DRAFT_333126 [Violaceomyces palustris]